MTDNIDYRVMWDFLKLHLLSLSQYCERHEPWVNRDRIEILKIIYEDMQAFEQLGSGKADELLYEAVNRKDD